MFEPDPDSKPCPGCMTLIPATKLVCTGCWEAIPAGLRDQITGGGPVAAEAAVDQALAYLHETGLRAGAAALTTDSQVAAALKAAVWPAGQPLALRRGHSRLIVFVHVASEQASPDPHVVTVEHQDGRILDVPAGQLIALQVTR